MDIDLQARDESISRELARSVAELELENGQQTIPIDPPAQSTGHEPSLTQQVGKPKKRGGKFHRRLRRRRSTRPCWPRNLSQQVRQAPVNRGPVIM